EPPGPALIRLLGPEHPRELRAGAATMLGQLEIHESLPSIGKLLEARDLTVRNAAASALGDLGDKEARQTLEGLLDDGALSTRMRAIRSLAKLKLPEVIPALRRRLADEYREIRLTAAEGLCHLGSSEGVPILLQDRNYLAFLNALRQPRLWQQLSSRRINIDGGALKSEYLEILEKEAGLPFEGAKELTAREEGCILWSARLDPIRQDPSWRRITVLEGVEMLASPNYAFVLEADRIRLLPPAEALKFWTDWWEQEGKKK
ncbi:MAG: HEAT repeat domain-containing protein, partial [Planctomycetes bacterium]|nr:HEAT repeat domain-containing protein [Planctomycetota bacterium]